MIATVLRISKFGSPLVALATAFMAAPAAAQATFYQVPSGDITKTDDVYLQQQSTLTDRLDLSLQAMFGLGRDFDMGASVYNFDLTRRGGRLSLDSNGSDRSEPFGPLLLATLQKRVAWARELGALVGIQSGPNVAPLSQTSVALRAYGNVVTEFGENRRCSAGAYVTNGIFVGGSSLQYAPWAGCDIEILDELLELQADWDFGSHASGAATVGPQLRLGKHVGIAGGLRIPNPWAQQSKWGAVLQFEVKDPLEG